jgi:DNA-binding NarL/FixJ family response regulator
MRVLIVDDHDLFRTGLRAVLEGEGFAVEEAASGAAALAACGWFEPDVVVLELHIAAIGRLCGARTRPALLVLTASEDDADVLAALRAGASSYLVKDAALEEIVAGIRAAAAGHSAIAPRVAGALLESVRSMVPAVPRQPVPVPELSERERQVLALVALGHGNVEIGRRLDLSPNTVKQHVSRLLRKLGADSRLQAASFAIRLGLADGTLA